MRLEFDIEVFMAMYLNIQISWDVTPY